MIQAFVSLKPQQPPRTESGMRSFFEALQGAVFSQPMPRMQSKSSVRAEAISNRSPTGVACGGCCRHMLRFRGRVVPFGRS